MTTSETVEFRPVALPFAEAGAHRWRQALLAQRTAVPAHSDFYETAAHLVDTLRALDGMAGVLASQVASYGAGRAVYDDEGANPAHRLRAAVLALAEARQHLTEADRAVGHFWSAIGHIGIRFPADPSGDPS